jgi:DNA end-binding protein Ku
MAARAVWTGSLSVGVLTFPVKLYTAVRKKSIAFNQVDQATGSRIRYQKVAEATDEVVPPEHIVKAYDLGGDQFVVLGDDDLASLAPTASKEIAVDVFVPAEQVPMVMFDASYIVGPGKLGAKPYALITRALAETGRVAIGKFVMRQKEYLAAVRSDGERLTLSTLVFADEVVDPASDEDLQAVVGVELSDREVTMAHSLVDALSDPFEPERYQDTYRAAVMELIEAKAEGRTIVIDDTAPDRGNVVDLASALEASIEAAKAARGRHPTARPARAAGAADDDTAAAAQPKKSAPRRRKSA